jgi:RNA polymerase sigma factor (sigma-70 family)
MMTIEAMQRADTNDAELVAESLDGNRDAFRLIVERYQTLISSLAYCATGNVSRSEDLAQETFVSAWKQLAELREPAKLRPWLCSIARFLISKEFRRQGREPDHAAESLEAMDEWVTPEPLPPDQAISDEEKAILWRSLERIPEIYREPLVLFYREQQSIEAVAQDLGLSEDAVKQRLSRGRKLLQEQFLAFVAGALNQTKPGKTFTLGVIAALPLLATTAKAASVGVAVAKGGSAAAKTTAWGGFLQASSNILLGFVYWLAPVLPLGGYIGYKMGGDRQHTERARRSVATFWRLMGVSMFLFVVLPLGLCLALFNLPHVSHPKIYTALGLWQQLWVPILMYAVVPLALVLWVWQRRRQAGPEAAGSAQIPSRAGRFLAVWVVLAMTGAVLYLGYSFWYQSLVSKRVPKTQFLSTAEAQNLIAGSKGRDMRFYLGQYENGFRDLGVELRENGTRCWFTAPAENSTLRLLADKGIAYTTHFQNRDFTNYSAAGRFLLPFCFFIVAAGAVTLLRGGGKRPSEPRPIAAARNERRVDKAFAALAACGMVAVAVLLGLTTDWKVRRVAADQVPGIIAQHKNARFEVFEYGDGSRKLWISGLRSPDFIAPADESTLGLLTRQGITYQTYLAANRGRPGLSQSISALGILLLAAAAGTVLWWVMRRKPFAASRIQAVTG